MEVVDQPRRVVPQDDECIVLSVAQAVRHLSMPLQREIEKQGLSCIVEEKLSAPESGIGRFTLEKLEKASIYITVVSRHCPAVNWQLDELRHQMSKGKVCVVLLEDRAFEWQADVLPTLITDRIERIGAFLANAKPAAMTIWEFAKLFFVDRATALQFQRAGKDTWRWAKPKQEITELSLDMALVDDNRAASSATEVVLVDARVIDGKPELVLGTADRKRYRFAYSREIRAVIPMPVFPGAPSVGFMHCDFDTGREWARAGDPPVEIRLLGRDVHGWHMSEFFWKAFVGSLPKMLGPQG